MAIISKSFPLCLQDFKNPEFLSCFSYPFIIKNMVNQKSQAAPKLQPKKMQTAGYTEGFPRLANANHFLAFSKKTGLKKRKTS